MSRQSEQRQARLKNLAAFQQSGINPYPTQARPTHRSDQFHKDFTELKTSQTKVTVAGRLMTIRRHGGSTFAHLQDEAGQLQLFLKKDELGEKVYNLFANHLDSGDLVEASGHAYTTQKGEPSLMVKKVTLLAKNLLPLPEKWHGLKDPELKRRKRYLDLLMDQSRQEVFVRRHLTITSIRQQLAARGYREVETPILQPLYGGTLAKPFVTHFQALDRDMYLRISNELYLKRLLVGGLEKVFEFSYDFRNEGVDSTHNPEFLQLETMTAYHDYRDSMVLLEDLLAAVAKTVIGKTSVTYQNKPINFTRPWRRLSLPQTLGKKLGLNLSTCSLAELVATAKKYGLTLTKSDVSNKGKLIEKLLDELIVPNLTDPTIVFDYPIETSPLAKEKADQPGWVERFEFFAAGLELGNSYSELNDPSVLRRNLTQQGGKDDRHPLDEDFIEALEIGLPPASGIGIGIDRLVMIVTNQTSIRDVTFFPMLKAK